MKHNTILRTKRLTMAALFAALTAVFAQIQITIGPIPLNLAVMGAFLAGLLLPPLWAAASMLVYLFMGLLGIPVFAGLMGGPAAVFGKTGGYALGYVFIALFTALAALPKKGIFTPLGMLAGLAACYTLGTAWFMLVTGTDLVQSLLWCVYPFVMPDLCKGVCACLLAKMLKPRMRQVLQ
jgi:biotin transport system substrate-specific component